MSFRVRLILIMTILLILAQLATATAMLRTASDAALERGSQELQVGARVLERMLSIRSAQLRDNVALLSADFGFKSAIATVDRRTIDSVLANHGERIGADLVMLTDIEGVLQANSHRNLGIGSRLPFDALWQEAQHDNGSAGIVMLGNTPYQLVLSPVYAPNLIAWVGMGFMLDSPLAKSLGSLTRHDVSFVTYDDDKTPPHIVTTLDARQQQMLLSLESRIRNGDFVDGPRFTHDGETLMMAYTLARQNDSSIFAVLQTSRQILMAPFQELKVQLLIIFSLAWLVTSMIAVTSARMISRPIQRLAEMARRIGLGERAADVKPAVKGEFALLANTLATMQQSLDRREAQLLYQSRHDSLTGLPNRTTAEQDIAELVSQRSPFTLLRLNINDFKQINDILGYAMGDQVLIGVAQRLLEQSDIQSYRFGGDEFVLLITGDQAPGRMMARFGSLMREPLMTADTQVTLKISIGEVASPEHGDTPAQLLRRSDIALYQAKETHTMALRYVPGSDEHHQRQLQIIHDLPRALRDGQLCLYYQPQIDINCGRVRQYEALARWHHPKLGFVPPDEFITLAEQSGNIDLLTAWLMTTVLHQLSAWRREGVVVNVAINLSAEDLRNDELPAQLRECLAHHAIPAAQLRLEITESAVMHEPSRAIALLMQLRDAGLELAIDDYGTGYSSLAQLKRMPVSELKIDKSFVMHMHQQPNDEVIVRSTVEMGHNLGLELVAEGVENIVTLKRLAALGCDYAQGYGIAKPMPAEAVLPWQREHDRRCVDGDVVLLPTPT
ncbi:EAL domain-containing protein [Halomonas sp. M20]|uniref:bifunctional diguanylate cyclase/phosphodiesterase n=1 Tax=Halomonas sp. M20 TaxID=2763264 RepID=UPI001D0BAE64|nr:EAL domain-containing protein [Halomonas sp. M20]